jgi:hypothetical protein
MLRRGAVCLVVERELLTDAPMIHDVVPHAVRRARETRVFASYVTAISHDGLESNRWLRPTSRPQIPLMGLGSGEVGDTTWPSHANWIVTVFPLGQHMGSCWRNCGY